MMSEVIHGCTVSLLVENLFTGGQIPKPPGPVEATGRKKATARVKRKPRHPVWLMTIHVSERLCAIIDKERKRDINREIIYMLFGPHVDKVVRPEGGGQSGRGWVPL